MLMLVKPARARPSWYSAKDKAPAMQPMEPPRRARSASGQVILGEDVGYPEAPPGRSTRKLSKSTASLLPDRLITQLEMITSTEPSGNGMSSIWPRRNSTLTAPASAALARARSSISAVMSRPYALPDGPTRRADNSTSMPPPDPRMKNRLTVPEVSDSERAPTAKAGRNSRLGHFALVSREIRAGAGPGLLLPTAGISAGRDTPVSDDDGGLRIAGPHPLAYPFSIAGAGHGGGQPMRAPPGRRVLGCGAGSRPRRRASPAQPGPPHEALSCGGSSSAGTGQRRRSDRRRMLTAGMGGDQRHQPQPDRISQRFQQRCDLLSLPGRRRPSRQRRATRGRIRRAQHPQWN